jgi:hypothetical protein
MSKQLHPAPALASLALLTVLLAPQAASAQVAGPVEAPVTMGPQAAPSPAAAQPTETITLTPEAPPAVAIAPEPEADAAEAPFKRRLFVGAVGGVGFAAVKHSDLATPKVYGAMLGLSLGMQVSPRWSVGIEYTNIERVVARDSGGERFASATSWLHTQAECNNCKDPNKGGAPLSWNMLLNVVGPKIEVTPFGTNGLYLGASGGVAILTLVDAKVGAGGTARLGARYTFADVLTIGAEGGLQGQVYSGSTVAVAFGLASLRFAMIEPGKKQTVRKVDGQGLPAPKRPQ